MKRKKQTTSEGHIEIVNGDLESHPQCPHGPTILFSRNVKGTKRNFFACAASRDRKHCNFFLWAENRSTFKKDVWQQEINKELGGINHEKLFSMQDMIKVPPAMRLFCHKCTELVDERENDQHKNHNSIRKLTDYQLKHPTEILPALENTKKEAQYLFSKSSVETMMDMFERLGYRHIICVGTPRIHEHLQNHCSNLTSILLDMDKRFHSFFGPQQYCWYNMFNHHFFFEEARDVFRNFLQNNNGKNIMLVTDPPFGGRTELIANTLNTINEEYKKLNDVRTDLPMFWIYPYFMEPQIRNSMPEFRMLDYKVEYENHAMFHNGLKGRKQGSPVRIFTNVDLRSIKLPDDDYKYCDVCDKWVAIENKHCAACNDCTSKSGVTYVHCSLCSRCVKPTWQHCEKCGRCTQKDHICEQLVFHKECYNCKEPGHKKADCPKNSEVGAKKRLNQPNLKPKKKKRKH
ncbi:unnamed protein product [Phaedon cochleariae]|uniref:CCHC-type domain-containing protein n=1 Tax=Phaedon cochleariae TaxID=80249 RepID=A0A9N9X2A7_PHACE|nr:unnamed protein product [Phaedon cochleariae]